MKTKVALAFLFSLIISLPVVASGDVVKGQQLYITCAACHGLQGEGKPAMKSPKIAGQYDWYLSSSIMKYRDGLRGADPKDQTGLMMAGMVKNLSDQQIADVVAFIMTLK
jgi:cytochrome c553